MTASIVVTGGTGTLGRVVVARLLDTGRSVRVISRSPGTDTRAEHRAVDLRTGRGLDEALRGTETIVHCASSSRGDVEAATHLIEASRRAGVGHLIYISIVGVDRVPLGYYRTKLAVERLVEAANVPWTVLRTTQFHDLLIGLWARQRRMAAVIVPAGTSFQPIDVREVGARLADLATGVAAGRVEDMGGPEIRTARDLARTYLAQRGSRRPVLPIRLPGRTAAAYRAGGHLAPDHAVGRGTYDDYLTEV